MRLKTIIASNMSEAMERVRKELGSDAIIISSVEEQNNVKVTAALENNGSKPFTSFQDQQAIKQNPFKTIDVICKILEHHHVPDKEADLILQTTSALPHEVLEKGVEAVLQEIFQIGPFPLFSENELEPEKPFILIGLSGSGKTVAVAKMAAELFFGGSRPEVITTDNYKSGAVEQLSTYTRAIGVTLHHIESLNMVQQTLKTLPRNVPLVIDTPGINPAQEVEVQFLRDLIALASGRTIMVLPAGMDPYEIRDTVEQFKEFGARYLIHTRVDVAHRFGGLLTSLARGSYQLAYFSSGPEVGKLLKPVSPHSLAELLLKGCDI